MFNVIFYLNTDLRTSAFALEFQQDLYLERNILLYHIIDIRLVIMSTGSLSDADDAPETSFARLDSHSEDDFNDDEGLNTKPKRANMQKRAKCPKDGRQSQRHAANARERARMRVLAKAFSRLKTSLPWVPADTKLSKLDTLRLASSYINHLRQLLHEDKYEKTIVHPVNLVWLNVLACLSLQIFQLHIYYCNNSLNR